MLTDLMAHQFVDDPNTPDEVEDEDFDLEAELARADAAAEALENDVGNVSDWESL